MTDSWDRSGEAVGDGEHGVAEDRHGLRSRTGADATGVLAQEDIAAPMEAVFDAPVVAHEGEQGLGSGLLAGQAGDGIDDLARDLALALAGPLDAANLRGPRPVKGGDDLAADREVADLEAAVPLVGRLGALTVRRRPVQGGRRKVTVQGLDQLRGEKRRQRRPPDQPAAPVGWL